MVTFHYDARDAEGKAVSGTLDAASVEDVISRLRARGLTADSITRSTSETPGGPGDTSAPQSFATVRPADPTLSAANTVEGAVLRSHMEAVLKRGQPIAAPLRAYAAEIPSAWRRRQLVQLCEILNRGDAGEATKALVDYPESWIPLVSASASANDPGRVLDEFLGESRRAGVLRQQWWLTLAYPIVLLCLATAVMTALALFVIPEFRAIFDEFDLLLPFITRMVLAITTFLSHTGVLIVLALLILLAVALLMASRWLSAPFSAWLSRRLRIPFGRRSSVARFARFIADLLDAGVSIPDALRIAGFTVNRLSMRRAAWQLANDIEATGGFSQSVYQRPLSASVTYALAAQVPEESRVRLLREISGAHADRMWINLSWATGIVEPIAIFVVGLVVGSVVIGLFLPLVKLVEGISN